MDRIEKTIEVDFPVETVYEHWTDFESFPRFMEGIKRVDHLGGKRLRWHAEIGGKDKSWEAEIVDEEPERKISWRSTSGAPNNGTVTFDDLGTRTRIRLLLEYEPETTYEEIGSKIGAVSARVEGDLRRFKEFLEGERKAKGTTPAGRRSTRVGGEKRPTTTPTTRSTSRRR